MPTSCVSVCCASVPYVSRIEQNVVIHDQNAIGLYGQRAETVAFSRASARSPINLGYNYISHCQYIECMDSYMHSGRSVGRRGVGRLVMYVHVHERGTIDCRQVGRRVVSSCTPLCAHPHRGLPYRC